MLIAVETGLEIFVVGTDVDVVGMVDFVDVFVVIGYWLFDVGIVDEYCDTSDSYTWPKQDNNVHSHSYCRHSDILPDMEISDWKY